MFASVQQAGFKRRNYTFLFLTSQLPPYGHALGKSHHHELLRSVNGKGIAIENKHAQPWAVR